MAKEPSSSDDKQPASEKTAEEAAKRGKQIRTGVAVGIGSAAIVAALLYANRGRKGDRGES